MRRGHVGRNRQIVAFFAWAGHSMKRPVHHMRTATYNVKTTAGASQRSHIRSHWLQLGGLINKHTDRQASLTTIRKPRRYGNPTASGLHTN